MIPYSGKYNTAKVMVDSIDEATAGQIVSFLNHQAFESGNIVIMPDCHYGAGSCIGFTQNIGEKLIPNVVGVDIGCGMLAYPIPEKVVDFEKLDNHIRKNVPFGFNIHQSTSDNRQWLSDTDVQKFQSISVRIGQREDKVLESLGTLGGGNHFIEVDQAPDGTLWLVIHSGSRNLGMATAQFHQKIAVEELATNGVTGIPKGLEYLEGKSAVDYLKDMRDAQQYASLNRLFMVRRVMEMFGISAHEVTLETSLECVHNYINFDDRIIRKGAISAHEGERVVIPLNMRDGIIFGTGKGNKDWNYSAPHGAGRVLSRGNAKRTLNVDDFQETMKGVWTSCVGQSTLDESPAAYKPMQVIMDVIDETVDVDYVAKPVYNFKAN